MVYRRSASAPQHDVSAAPVVVKSKRRQAPTTLKAFDIASDGSSGTKKTMLQQLAGDIIGAHTTFKSPFGVRAMSYADFTASGKALQSIEDFIQAQVLPLYGNTHTTTSATGLRTTAFRDEARHIIAKATNANIDGPDATDCVLFTGSGTTSAIVKLITVLQLHTSPKSRADDRPVVFVGPFEHHSNILPWRESAADVIAVPEDATGHIDITFLRQKLHQYRRRPLKIGSFSAASNLTGLLTDVNAITALLHQHGALAFWDYASCAPYVDIDMNPVVDGTPSTLISKDAVFLSGHKFVGGPGTPGVLIVKTKLLTNTVPTMPGGGTVLFVTETAHHYLDNRVEREEGGTPDIVGSIRLGLAFQIKQRVGPTQIMEIERNHVKHVRESLSQNPNIVLLGRDDVADHQLPIFSFLLRFGDRFLHYNFVCALLNDLFGIQTRGGCQCAGPYGARLLGLAKADIMALGYAVADGDEVLKPGFSRMSFPYFMDDAQVDYILEAVHFVATEGWKFLPQYSFDRSTGAWFYSKRVNDNFGTTHHRLSEFEMHTNSQFDYGQSPLPALEVYQVAAHRRRNMTLARTLARLSASRPITSFCAEALELSHEGLRWFVYPSEVVAALRNWEFPPLTAEATGPCQPQRYMLGTLRHQWEEEPTGATSTAAARVQWAKTAMRRAVDLYVCYPRKPRRRTATTNADDSEPEVARAA